MAGEDQTAVCLTHIADRLESIDGRLADHGETLVRLDERSQQHEKRMNRTDARGGLFGGAAGGLLATVVVGLKMWLGKE